MKEYKEIIEQAAIEEEKRRKAEEKQRKEDEKRRKAAYPELGLAVDHLRVEDIPADCVPNWLTLAGEG